MGLFFNRKSKFNSKPAPSCPTSKVREYSGDIFVTYEIPASKFFQEKGIRLKKVYSGIGCYAAIDDDGVLWSWSNRGSDGNGFMKSRSSETPIKILDSVKKVFISERAALREDDTLWGWVGYGYPIYWHNSDTYRFENETWELIARDVTDVSGRTLINSQGSLYVSGDNSYQTLDPSIGENEMIRNPRLFMHDVLKAEDSIQNMGVIKRDGSLWLWGLNYGGQLGNGSTDACLSPHKVLDNVKDFLICGWTVAAIKNDSSLWAWGKNEDALVGNGSFKNQLTPIKILDNVSSVMGSDGFLGAITMDRSLWVWGRNRGGRFMCEPNSGSTETFKEPKKLFENVKEVTPFGTRILAIKNDGTAWAWGGFGDYGADMIDGFFSAKRFTPQQVLSNANYAASIWNSECFIVKDDESIWSIRDRSTDEYFDYLHQHYGRR